MMCVMYSSTKLAVSSSSDLWNSHQIRESRWVFPVPPSRVSASRSLKVKLCWSIHPCVCKRLLRSGILKVLIMGFTPPFLWSCMMKPVESESDVIFQLVGVAKCLPSKLACQCSKFVLSCLMIPRPLSVRYDLGLCKQPRQKADLGQLFTVNDVASGHVRPDEFCIKCEVCKHIIMWSSCWYIIIWIIYIV